MPRRGSKDTRDEIAAHNAGDDAQRREADAAPKRLAANQTEKGQQGVERTTKQNAADVQHARRLPYGKPEDDGCATGDNARARHLLIDR